MVDPVSLLNSFSPLQPLMQSTMGLQQGIQTEKPNGFIQIIEKVEASENKINNLVEQLSTGKAESIHHVMIEMEQARMHFELFLQVRNKALEAYQELMRIQL